MSSSANSRHGSCSLRRTRARVHTLFGAFVAGFLAASLIVVPIYRARDRRSKARERATLAATIERERASHIDVLAQRNRSEALQRKLEDADERLSYATRRMYTLKDAAVLGDDFSVRRLIHAGIDDDKHAALRLAVEHNRLSTVKILIQAGADVHLFDEEGWQGITDNRLIRIAAANGNVGIVRCLFDCGVKVTGADENGYNSLSDAIESRQTRMVEFLLSRGVPHTVSRHGFVTDLMLACEKGDAETVQVLLAHSAALLDADRWGKTALDYAINGRHENIVSKLRRAGLHIRYDRSQDENRMDHEDYLATHPVR